MKAAHGITPVFDEPNLASAAGLVPVPELAESAGFSSAVSEQVASDGPGGPVVQERLSRVFREN